MRVAFASFALLLGVTALSFALPADDKIKPADKDSGKPFADAEFVTMAASGGMHEVELGKMASEKAHNPDIKKFGKMMVADHTKANEELKKVAKAANMPVPDKLMEKHQKMVDMFKELKDDNFDKEYIKHAVESHEMSVALYTKASTEAKNEELKAFAAKTLPTVKDHLKMAHDLQGKDKGQTKDK